MNKLLTSVHRVLPFGFSRSDTEPSAAFPRSLFFRPRFDTPSRPFTVVHGAQPQRARTAQARIALEKASAIFHLVLKIEPQSWTAAWLAGKAAQGLDEPHRAYGLFKRAFELQPNNLDVAREFTLACLDAGRANEAIAAARQAVDLAENDAGLKANLALAHLCAGDCDRALALVTAALAQKPRDPISLTLRSRVVEVQRGERPVPLTPADLQTPVPALPEPARPALVFAPDVQST